MSETNRREQSTLLDIYGQKVAFVRSEVARTNEKYLVGRTSALGMQEKRILLDWPHDVEDHLGMGEDTVALIADPLDMRFARAFIVPPEISSPPAFLATGQLSSVQAVAAVERGLIQQSAYAEARRRKIVAARTQSTQPARPVQPEQVEEITPLSECLNIFETIRIMLQKPLTQVQARQINGLLTALGPHSPLRPRMSQSDISVVNALYTEAYRWISSR